jgi:large subunit ribosomal protein L20
MPRAKTGVVRRRRHKKILEQTKGFYLTRSKLFRRANEAFLKAGEYAFFGRQLKKRDMKKLWIIRLNAAVKALGYSYSNFMQMIKKGNIQLDRKVLSEMAVTHPKAFESLVKKISGVATAKQT